MTRDTSPERDRQGISWHNAIDVGIEGQGWTDTVDAYDRLPAKAERLVRKEIWHMKRSSTGMSIRFRTSAREIHARWEIEGTELGEENFNRCAHSGLDLYGDDDGIWKWVKATQHFDSHSPEVCIVSGLDGVERDYLLYLPLRNKLLSLEVGVPHDAGFSKIAPKTDPPIAVYGSSIVQGAYASRAGMVYPSILGRRLQLPVVNLGFSGNAHMEPEIADLMGDLTAAAYVLDPMPNMDLAMVEERTAGFILSLRKMRPQTPIVMVGDFQRTNSWILPESRAEQQQKLDRCREILGGLIRQGVAGLHFVDGEFLLGNDHEASIDGIHPSDLGYVRMADQLEPVLRRALAEKQ